MERILTIGRDASCDIYINDPSCSVSRIHATLRVDGRKLYLTDHSTNGTYKNGIRLLSNTEYLVSREDEISFAHAAYLDWSYVPKDKTAKVLKVVLITIASVAIAGALATAVCFMVKNGCFDKHKESADVVEQPVKEQEDAKVVEEGTVEVQKAPVAPGKTTTTNQNSTGNKKTEKENIVPVQTEEVNIDAL